MEKFVIVCLLGLCVVSDVFAVDETHYSTYEWMKGKLVNMLCRLDSETEPTSQQEVTPVCDNKWTRFESSCYLFSTKAETFDEAKAICNEYGAHHVSIQSENEQDFIKEYVAQLSDTTNIWIGLTDIANEGVWKWSGNNEEAQFVGWNTGEPNGGRAENCVALIKKNQWYWSDITCGGKFQFICEK